MFSLKKLAIAGVFMAAVAAPAIVGTNVLAANNSNACTAEAAVPNIGTRIQPNHKFTKQDGRVYIKVVVHGGKNCQKTVTLESWKAPNGTDGKPYKEQTLYLYKTVTFGPGEHRMSVQLPNCYFQVDLIHGSKTMGASPDADIKFDADRVIGSVHGGNQACVNVPDTPDTPEVPETPTTPTTPTTPAPSTTTTSLTKTGPGAIVAGIFTGVSSLGTAAHYFVRRKLMNA